MDPEFAKLAVAQWISYAFSRGSERISVIKYYCKM
jgi:hypothetical protein